MLRYQHFANFPASGSLSTYMHLPCIQTSLKTLILDEIASTFKGRLGTLLYLRNMVYFPHPSGHKFLKGIFDVSFVSLPYMLAWILVLSERYTHVCITKYIKKYYGLCDTTVALSIIYIYSTNNIKIRSHSFIFHSKMPSVVNSTFKCFKVE